MKSQKISLLTKRFYLFILPFLIFSVNLYAFQADDNAVISGSVIDETGSSVPGATVSLLVDGEVVDGIATDVSGDFTLEADPGNYLLRVSFVSYATFEKEVELAAGEEYTVETIQLEEETQQLGEVLVESETADVEMRYDRRIYRADSDIEAMGGSALDLLDNIPSVESDIEGNLSLRGSENVRVLINGRSSSLLSDGTEALAAIPSESIDRVEVIPNPSARYQAEGDAGVINIILKRNRVAGFSGSALGRTGIPGDHRLSTNLNFMANNVNWFTNIGFRYRDRPSEAFRFQRFESADTSYMYNQVQDRMRTELRGNVRAGAEIFIGERQTLTPSVYFRFRDRNNQTDTFYRDMDLSENLLGEVFREEDQDEDRMDMELDLRYEYRFSEYRVLNLDASIDYRPEWESGSLFEENRTVNQVLGMQRTDIDEQRTRIRFNADYVHPLKERIELEAGARSSFQWIDNDYGVLENIDGNWEPIDQFSFDFNYYRNVNALYGIASVQFGDFSLQGGLRAEQTVIDTEVTSTGSTDRQNYFDIFPSAFLGYEFNDQNSVQLSYSRRFSRPRMRSILPFSNFRDSRNIYTGNPLLNPVYSDSYEVSYMRFWQSGSLTTSLYHRYRSGVIETITDVGDGGVTRRSPINLSNQSNWGTELALNQRIGESIRLRGSINYFQSETEGELNNQLIERSSRVTFGRMRVQWRIADGLNFQTTYMYSGPRNTTQGSRDGTYHVNSGLSMDLFDGDATLTFSGFDLFNTRGRVNIIDEPGFYSESENRWRTRSFRVNFVYRFSSFNS
ncbi:MAG: TonB-dependent receptor [Balneolaceae bacterium]|nr:TonB-dependent receptor [Balneolaceae bacterium]